MLSRRGTAEIDFFHKIRRISSTVLKDVRARVRHRPVVGVSIAFGQRRAFGSKFRGRFAVVAGVLFLRAERNVVERLTV